MRIDAASSQNLLTSLANLNSQETSIASQISSGVRLTKLSDDPTAVAQAALLADSTQRSDSFIASANTVSNRFQTADTALSSVVSQLTSALSTATAAVNGTLSDANRSVDVAQLTSIRQSLLSLANSSYSNNYLFSGTSTSQPFTQAANGDVTYTGNSSVSELPLDAGGTVATSLVGANIFTAPGASIFGALNDLITNLTNNTVTAANAGTLVGALQTAAQNVTTQRGLLNSAQLQVTGETTYTTTQEANLKAQQSALVAADTATLATQLSAATTQRSALLATLGIIDKGSLFDYLSG